MTIESEVWFELNIGSDGKLIQNANDSTHLLSTDNPEMVLETVNSELGKLAEQIVFELIKN